MPDPDPILHRLAFENAAQASIIFDVNTGIVIAANKTACTLLEYDEKELLAESRKTIFDTSEEGFQAMLKERKAEGNAVAKVKAITKTGKRLPCEITSAVFRDEDEVEKAITTITDLSQAIHEQKGIDSRNAGIVADNIILALEKSEDLIIENSEWIKHIATTSYDVMWDWDIISGEIYIGDSIEDVFGYKISNNIIQFSEIKTKLFPAHGNNVEERLMAVLASDENSWNDAYDIEKFDGTLASVISRATIIRDSEGKAARLIGATQDVTLLQELEKKLKDQDIIKKEDAKVFRLAARLSYDGIWDWNIVTGEFFLGQGFEQLFGYPVKKTPGEITDWSKHLHPDDKEAVEKGLDAAIHSNAIIWEQAYRLKRKDGSVVDVLGKASIMRDAGGKASRMIGAIHDLTKQKDLENKLRNEIAARGKFFTAFQENFRNIFDSSAELLYDLDLLTGQVVLSDAYEKEFGYKIKSGTTTAVDWFSHIHPDEKEKVMQDMQDAIAAGKTNWKCSFRFLKADQTITDSVITGVILKDSGGKAYRMMGSMQDFSNQKILEKKLELEIRLKESQIAEAAEDAKESERSEIGKELHDNVNQLLGVSKLYLEMSKRGDAHSRMYLDRSSEYTLSAIEAIRALTKTLTTDVIKNLGLCEAIENIVKDTMEVNPVKISVDLKEFNESGINNKFKLNIFRIIQEQLNNILKHAHATNVFISLSKDENAIVLKLSDNGVGFDTQVDHPGIGIENIKSRAAAYKGTAEFISEQGQGCLLNVRFPDIANTAV